MKSAIEFLFDPVSFEHKLTIHEDSRLVSPGGIFVLSKRNKNFFNEKILNNLKFVLLWAEHKEYALALSDRIILCENEDNVKSLTDKQIGAIIISDKKTSTDLLVDFYGPSNVNSIAITGTNGKTSVTTFVRQLLSATGLLCSSVENGEIVIADNVNMNLGHSLTTPSVFDMHKIVYVTENLYKAKKMVFEASSHGLYQGRISGINITTAAFTNLSQDHLDYHITLENYFAAKKLLFSTYLSEKGVAVLNQDIPEYESLKQICNDRDIKIITYGTSGGNVHLLSSKAENNGQNIVYKINGKEYNLFIPVSGSFQALNLACAIGICLNETDGKVCQYLESASKYIQSPPGRMERVTLSTKEKTNIYIDFAHTPDAMRFILSDSNRIKKGKLIVVFGCGGDRDISKRPEMGNIASNLADLVFITDDNPRTEDSAKIRKDIIDGIKEENMHKIIEVKTNRRDAIQRAIDVKEESDIVLILGKGHEKYQIIGTEKHLFDDYKVAKDSIKIKLHK